MALALAEFLAEHPDLGRRFLRATVGLESPSITAATAAGVPAEDAASLLSRLERAGEVREGVWQQEVRGAYLRWLSPRQGPSSRLLSALAVSERPREKALSSGIEALSDIELIALVLRTGSPGEGVLEAAGRLMHQHDGLAGLARRTVEELIGSCGLGTAKAAQLAASFEIGRRIARATLRERPQVRTAQAVSLLLSSLASSLPHEELWCLALDAQSRVIGEPRVVSKGDVDGTDAGPRAFFRLALSAGATSCIAVHNHPGGDPTPSSQDRAVTVRLAEAGRTLDLPLVDHVVLAAGGRYASIRSLHPGCFGA